MNWKKLFNRKEEKLRVFPLANEVFNNDVERAELVFFPLLSIKLSEILPKRDEWVHFVDVWDNGDINPMIHNRESGLTSITFELNNSKYDYHGQIDSFPEAVNLPKWLEESKKEMNVLGDSFLRPLEPNKYEKSKLNLNNQKRKASNFDYFHYVQQQVSYSISKKRYSKFGELIPNFHWNYSYELKPRGLYVKIGGEVKFDKEEYYPKDEKGERLIFIGQIKGYNYFRNGSESILLFFNEYSNTVVEIFENG